MVMISPDKVTMKNYRRQDGCHNCRYVFKTIDYDSPLRYFCTLDAPERPKCGSVAMPEESWNLLDDEEFSSSLEAWHKWADPRRVAGWAVCDSYERHE
jgi:hypothetical protein